jgi:hypothetical protein
MLSDAFRLVKPIVRGRRTQTRILSLPVLEDQRLTFGLHRPLEASQRPF